MKLVRIQLQQWRQFRTPFAIDGLQAGINLFAGPNESGKSTLVEALQAAFFERHRSGTVTQFQPWGDSSAEPSVSLVFEWQNQTWRLDKRFLGRARCDLDVNGSTWTGDEAEDRLTRLMGYSLAGRGASRPEHRGIPGLLWVRQGTVQELRQPVEHAADHLQAALGKDLGTVASSSGDRVLDEIADMRGQLLTRAGQPRGDYKQVERELTGQQAELQKLDADIAAYEEQVDTLARLQAERRQIDAARPWEARRSEAAKAEARLTAVNKLIEEQKQARRDLDHCQTQQKLLREKLRGFDDEAGQLGERDKARSGAQQALDDLRARSQGIETRQDEARKAYERAERIFQQARQQARRRRLQTEHDALEAALDKDVGTLAALEKLQEEWHGLQALRLRQAVDPDRLEKLEKTQRELDTLALRKEVAATRLGWSLEAGKTLSLDGQGIGDSGERLLLQAADIVIPGVGQLHITPGGRDIGELAREELRLAGDRASLLAELGAPDLAGAQARAAACQRTDTDIERIRNRVDALAPDGVQAFREQIRIARTRIAALATRIEALPPVDDAVPGEDEAERTRNDAGHTFKAADEALRRHRGQLGLAGQAFEAACGEWQRLKSAVEAPERRQAREKAGNDLTDQRAAEQTLTADLDKRQAQIDAADPQLLQDDVERFSKSADALEDTARERQRNIELLQTRLETLGARGLEDQRGELRQTINALQRRRDQLAARARALDLLHILLQEQRQALTRRLQAPLQEHLTRYLRLLFPDAEIQVDENLVPTLLQRTGQHGAFDDLSYGAREQLGLISRLAYADLLKAAGKPTLILLDDALVHSDASRLAQMKRILYDAARRHQILLFTCHPANWNDLGVPVRDLPGMKAEAA